MSESTSSEPVNLTVEVLRELRDEMRLFRREQSDMRALVLATFDRSKRVERKLEEVRDDLEGTIKAEIMGRLANFETEIERKIDALRSKISPQPPAVHG